MNEYWARTVIDPGHFGMDPETLADKLMGLLVNDSEITNPTIATNLPKRSISVQVCIKASDLESAKAKFRDSLNAHFYCIGMMGFTK